MYVCVYLCICVYIHVFHNSILLEKFTFVFKLNISIFQTHVPTSTYKHINR